MLYAFTEEQLRKLLQVALERLDDSFATTKPEHVVKEIMQGIETETQLLQEGEPVQQTFLPITNYWLEDKNGNNTGG